ncbi:MAG: hypothetical protein Q7S89_01215 [bacterium]|nr:hypothetical protein [bacterium]
MKRLYYTITTFFLALFATPAMAANDGLSGDIKQSLLGFGARIFGRAPTIERTTLATTIGVFLQWFLAVNGLAFLILMLYAGNKWMGAAGNDEAVETAKKTLVRAIVGFVVCVAGFALIQAVGLLITGSGLGQ